MKLACQTQSLDAFGKFREAAVSFVVSFCLSFRQFGKSRQQSTAHAHCPNVQLCTDSQWCTFSQAAEIFPVLHLHTAALRTVVATSVPTVHRSSSVRHCLPAATSVQTVSYVFLLLCMLCSVYPVFIVPSGILRLPWLRFFRAFPPVVRQMPGYNSQRRGTARAVPN